jgi:hypothetical protein
MKSNFYIFLLFTASICHGQFVKAPDFEFGGTKIEWSHTLTDPWEDDFPSNTYKSSEVGIIVSPAIEVDNKIIFKVFNSSNYAWGEILAAFDSKSGDQAWLRYLNPQNHNNYGTKYYADMKVVENSTISLSGINSFEKLPTDPLQTRFSTIGHYSKEEINIHDGNTVNLTKFGNEIVSFGTQSPLQNQEGNEFIYMGNKQLIPAGKDTRIYPVWINYKDRKVYNANGLDTTNQILYKTRNSAGSFFGPVVYGPFTVSHNAFGFLAYTYYDLTGKYYYWITDQNANILFRKDISGEINSLFRYDQSSSIQQFGEYIVIRLVTEDGTRFGHGGYAILDMNGNVVRKKALMVIDGNKVTRIITTPIKNSGDLLHVINFQQSNDVFLYREGQDGTFVKVGQLENKNSQTYPYIPKYVMQTSDDGIVITGTFLTEESTGCRLDCVGWPLIIKLSAATLGLPVSLPDLPDEPYTFTISPNPAQDRCVVSLSEDISVGTLIFTDFSGKRVYAARVVSGQNELDISHLPSGVYVCHTESEGGNKYSERKKLVIMR